MNSKLQPEREEKWTGLGKNVRKENNLELKVLMNKVDISILGIRAKVFFRILSINAWILVVVPNLKEEVYHQESWAKILVCTHSNSAADLYIKVE